MPARDADYVFVGAGVAGLSLACALAARGLRGRRLLLIDPRSEHANDRTFCFWNVVPHAFEDLASHRWPCWRVRAPGRDIVRSAPGIEYQHLPAAAFYARALARLDEAGVELRLGVRAHAVVDEGDGVRVETDAGVLRASLAFDSRPPAPEVSGREVTLLQHFEGWHVRLDEPRFDPRVATLMDFEVPQDHGIHFVYVLPYGEREGLVEATWFGRRALGEAEHTAYLERYLRTALRSRRWEIVRRERGVIPMSTRETSLRPSRRVYRIGLAGGMAKPSTGYAFQAIQRFSRELAARLDVHELPEPPRPRPWRATALDRIFLSYLDRYPVRAPDVFATLFERVEPALLVRFLSDRASGPECLRVMRALPFAPFTLETLRSARLWLR
ncbi:MAG TPA: lycopene cyclase family protein [Sandaracinaceae bacterium]